MASSALAASNSLTIWLRFRFKVSWMWLFGFTVHFEGLLFFVVVAMIMITISWSCEEWGYWWTRITIVPYGEAGTSNQLRRFSHHHWEKYGSVCLFFFKWEVQRNGFKFRTCKIPVESTSATIITNLASKILVLQPPCKAKKFHMIKNNFFLYEVLVRVELINLFVGYVKISPFSCSRPFLSGTPSFQISLQRLQMLIWLPSGTWHTYSTILRTFVDECTS